MLLRLFIDRKQMRIVECVFALDAAKENPHRAVPLGEANLIEGHVHRLKRQHRHPLHPLRRLGAGLGEKTIVGAAQRDF